MPDHFAAGIGASMSVFVCVQCASCSFVHRSICASAFHLYEIYRAANPKTNAFRISNENRSPTNRIDVDIEKAH